MTNRTARKATILLAAAVVLGTTGAAAAGAFTPHTTAHHDPTFIRCADKTGDDDMQACFHTPTKEDPRAYLIWHEGIWLNPDASLDCPVGAPIPNPCDPDSAN